MGENGDLQDFESIVDDDGVLKKIVLRGLIPVKPSQYSEIIAEICRTYEEGPKKGKTVESDEGKDGICAIHFDNTEGDSDGLKCALLSMELGEISEFILQPEYTDSDEVLHYRIKLVDFYRFYECPTRSREIYIIGPDYGQPLMPGQKVDIHAKGYCDGKLYHDHKSSVYVGDAGYTELPRTVVAHLNFMRSQGGWMRLNDTREISAKEREKFGFPSDVAVWYNVEVTSSEIDNIVFSKEKADDFFRAGKSQVAEKIYEYCTNILNEESKETYDKALLNAALASLQNNHPDKCIDYCLTYENSAGEDDNSHFRLGQAYFMKYDFRKAEEHFKRALEFSNDNNKPEISQAAHLSDCRYKTKYDNILKTIKDHGPVRSLSHSSEHSI
ncbi:unnamed protein product [Hymenolepis diminuta]|uniref:peptidylprolyl isomerase n=1 Tax=Hymenolepis diminuta TaxID=6216 RepID=A0A0R3SAI3_HYMDI|nr:unnamed protein product [Hymenolepis diminuta]